MVATASASPPPPKIAAPKPSRFMRLFSNENKRHIWVTGQGAVCQSPDVAKSALHAAASLPSSISRKTPATAHMLKYGSMGGGGGGGYRSTVRGPEPPSRKAVSTPRLQRATSEELGVSHAGAIQDDEGSSNMAGKVQAGACTLQGSSSHANMSSSHPDIPSASSPIPHAHAPSRISPPASSCAAAALHVARHSLSSRSTSRARLSRFRTAAAAMATDDVGRPCEGVRCWSTG
jgi:hypothetical protein